MKNNECELITSWISSQSDECYSLLRSISPTDLFLRYEYTRKIEGLLWAKRVICAYALEKELKLKISSP